MGVYRPHWPKLAILQIITIKNMRSSQKYCFLLRIPVRTQSKLHDFEGFGFSEYVHSSGDLPISQNFLGLVMWIVDYIFWSLFHCLGRLPNTSTFYVPSSPFFRLQHIWKCAQKTQTFAMNVLLYFASICHSTKDSQCWLLNKLFCFLCLQVYFDCHIFCFEMSQEKPEGGGK